MGSSLNYIPAVPSEEKIQPSTSLKTTDIFHLDNRVISILKKGRSYGSFLQRSEKNMDTVTKKTKQNKILALGSIDRQLLEPRLGKSLTSKIMIICPGSATQ